MGKLPKGLREKIKTLSKKQLYIVCGLLVVLAVLLGFGIKGLFGGQKDGLDSQKNKFTQEGIEFVREKENIQRGDLIIFKRDNALDGYLIKRVIALGGDTVKIDDNGNVYVNEEKYQTDKLYYKKDVQLPITLGENELFVLGENDAYADSRMSYVGNVKKEEVEGISRP